MRCAEPGVRRHASAAVAAPLALLLALFLASCGSGGGGGTGGGTGGGGGNFSSVAACEATLPSFVADASPNVLTVDVDQGPCAYGVPYGSPTGTASSVFIINPANIPYTTITICPPGQSRSAATCQTIDHVLVDTGSSGVRILSSVLDPAKFPNGLPKVTNASGDPMIECMQFADGNSWGSLRSADVVLSNSPTSAMVAASQVVQVIGDSESLTSGRSQCVSGGVAANIDVATMQANGVLGVSYFTQDCGAGCAQVVANTWFYTCPSASTCVQSTQPVASQPSNPVLSLASDSNGVILQMGVPANGADAGANVKGRLIFGIGTQADNSASAFTAGPTVYAASPYGIAFASSVTYPSGTASVPALSGFMDSGSNGIYLPDLSISTDCTAKPLGWYATPPAPIPSGCSSAAKSTFPVLVSVGLPSAAGSVTVPLTINDAASLFAVANANAFLGLGAPADTSSAGPNWGVDLGLPFLFGKNIGVVPELTSITAPVPATGPAWIF